MRAALVPGVHLLEIDDAWFEQVGAQWRLGLLEGGDDRREVLGRLGRALNFPDYYGENMDAAWDCLTDFTEPTALVWRGWQDFAVAHPHAWAGLLGMFNERCALQPDFAVVLAR
ncbi:barstar family protein [Propionibacteriaceae bacterium Y1923]|uniref:barstar family protein n=1 Tax=Aestuariimicrobium sp. Y1814 TaxID=3418742 RepID=UPI003C17E130